MSKIDWAKHVDNWKQSGISQREYCERSGVALNRFVYWRNRLSGEERLEGTKFVEVGVKGACFEIVTGGGTKIRVPESYTLKRLLEVVE